MDGREREALSRAKRRVLNALGDWRQRHNVRALPRGERIELTISPTDYLLLRSHELVDGEGNYRDGPLKLRSG